MKKIVLYSIIFTASITIFGLLLFWGPGYISGTHTKYCPFSHMISDTAVCVVLNSKDNRILIQHADLDSNKYSLEIIENERSFYYKLPSFITRLALKGYTGRLIENKNDEIMINGQLIRLIPVDSN